VDASYSVKGIFDKWIFSDSRDAISFKAKWITFLSCDSPVTLRAINGR
jgi:hypothetical protein